MDFALTPPETRNQKRMRKFAADYTPPHVVLTLLRWVKRRLRPRVKRYLDPCSGAGIWGQVARGLWEGVESVGVEPREEELRHMQRNYSHALLMPFINPPPAANEPAPPPSYMEQRADLPLAVSEKFDLIAGNPPFDPAWSAEDKVPWYVEILKSDLLEVGGVLALYGLSQWGQTIEMWPHLGEYSPALQVRLTGRVAHRDDGETDSREYSMWCWLKGHADPFAGLRSQWGSPAWLTVQVEAPPVRKFKNLPGTYDLPPEFFAEAA